MKHLICSNMSKSNFRKVPTGGDLIIPSRRAAGIVNSLTGTPKAFYAWLDEGANDNSNVQQISVPWDMPGIVLSINYPRSPGSGPRALVSFPIGVVNVALARIEIVE